MTSLKTSIKTITYLSDIGCLEIQGASLLAMLAMTAFTLMTRRGICEMQNVAPDGKGIRLELIGFRENETIPDTLH